LAEKSTRRRLDGSRRLEDIIHARYAADQRDY
jgi:hypothetical protein